MPKRTFAEVFAPGEFIREELEARGWTVAELARIMDIPLGLINELVTGSRVFADSWWWIPAILEHFTTVARIDLDLDAPPCELFRPMAALA